MGKPKKGGRPKYKTSKPTRCEERKSLRKAERKLSKIKKAINYTNINKSSKVCINKKDLDVIKSAGLLISNPSIQDALKGKILSNKSNDLNKPGKKKKKGKKKTKNSLDSLKNKDISIKADDIGSSFIISSSTDSRMAQLQEYVNRESHINNEEQHLISESKDSKTKSKNMNDKVENMKDKLIDDEDALTALRIDQNREEKTIKFLQNKLVLNAYQKKSYMPKAEPNCGLADFGELLNDIELGNMDRKSHLYNNLSDSDDDEVDNKSCRNKLIDSDDNESEYDSERSEIDGEVIKTSNGINSSCSLENSDNDSALETDEDCDDMILGECNEVNDFTDDDDDDSIINDEEEKLCAIFEGGSSYDNKSSSRITVNNIFDLYESETENDDEELEDFIVDDDVIEYESESSYEKSPLKIKRKRKRIRMVSESSEDVGSPCKSIIVDSSNGEAESINRNCPNKKRVRFTIPDESEDDRSIGMSINSAEPCKIKINVTDDELREDIYGRLIDNKGIVKIPNEKLSNCASGSYVPPHLRKLKEISVSTEKREHLTFLHRKIKGLLNRLGESNMQYISNQLEDQYLKNSRNDVNETLTNLLMEAIVMPTLTSEKSNRRIQEHALMVAILSSNVGSEIGAHILTEFVIKFIDCLNKFIPNANNEEIDSKELDNLLLFISYIYGFKVVGVSLIYDIIQKLLENFESKQIDLLLLMLSSIGFCLREDNPIKLKEIIINIQNVSKERASKETDNNFTRIRFMLDILTSIKHNNMRKVPNYDPEVTKHFQSLYKSIVKKGRKSSGLNVTLSDLLKSQTMGKWWVIGSAWSDDIQENSRKLRSDEDTEVETKFGDKFMKKAMQLRLSRVPRINILYALTEGADDQHESFNQLLQIKLTPVQEIEIFNVLLVCNNKYKYFNIVYVQIAILLIKFRGKYRKLLQTSLWNSYSDLNSLKKNERSNLSLFTSHLIAENALDLFLLKEFDFVKISEIEVIFLRQTLRSIFDHPLGNAAVTGSFTKLSNSKNLKMLRECLRIFIQQYVIPKKDNPEGKKKLLLKRSKLALSILSNCDGISL